MLKNELLICLVPHIKLTIFLRANIAVGLKNSPKATLMMLTLLNLTDLLRTEYYVFTNVLKKDDTLMTKITFRVFSPVKYYQQSAYGTL